MVSGWINPFQLDRRFFKNLREKFPVPAPDACPVSIEGVSDKNLQYQREPRDTAYVIKYDFLKQQDSLLSDFDLFGNPRNFVSYVNPNDPFNEMKIPENETTLSEMQSGDFYWRIQQFCLDLMKKEGRVEPYWVLGKTFYADKAATDKLGRRTVEPMMFVETILNQACRNQPRAKRIMAFIPDFNRKSKVAKERANNTRQGKGRTVRNYHRCLSEALVGYFNAMGFEKRILAWVRYGDHVKLVRVFFPLVTFLGDAKSQDVICGRYGSIFCQRPCHACLCPFLGLPLYNDYCRWKSYEEIRPYAEIVLKSIGRMDYDDGESRADYSENSQRVIEATEKLKSWSIHPHQNALHPNGKPLPGHEKYGVFGATATDPMHVFLHGVLSRGVDAYIDLLSAVEKHVLDKFVDYILLPQRQTVRRLFPRVDYTNGVSNLTQVTADEWAGVAFTVLIFLMTKPGISVHSSMMKSKFKIQDPEAYKSKGIHQIVGLSLKPGSETVDNVSPSSNVIYASDDDDDDDDVAEVKFNFRKKSSLRSKLETPLSRKDMVWILEKLLTMYAWYRRGAPYKNWFPKNRNRANSNPDEPMSDNDSVEDSSDDGSSEFTGDEHTQRWHAEREIRLLVGAIVKLVPRTEGVGWYTQKVHEVTHIVRQMSEFGPPMGFDCGNWESGLKFVATKPGRLVRSCTAGAKQYIESINKRLTESSCSAKAFQYISVGRERARIKSLVHSLDHVNPEVFHHPSDDELDENYVVTHKDIKSKWGHKPFYELNVHNEYYEDDDRVSVRTRPEYTILAKHAERKGNTDSSTRAGVVLSGQKRQLSKEEEVDQRRKGADQILHGIRKERSRVRCSSEATTEITITTGQWWPGRTTTWALQMIPASTIPRDMSPSKIIAFFEHPFKKTNDGKHPRRMALVHAASRPLEEEYSSYSQLCEVWEMEYNQVDPRITDCDGNGLLRSPHIECIDCDCLDAPVFVVEEEAGLKETKTDKPSAKAKRDRTIKHMRTVTKRAVLLRPFSCWPEKFLPDFHLNND